MNSPSKMPERLRISHDADGLTINSPMRALAFSDAGDEYGVSDYVRADLYERERERAERWKEMASAAGIMLRRGMAPAGLLSPEETVAATIRGAIRAEQEKP